MLFTFLSPNNNKKADILCIKISSKTNKSEQRCLITYQIPGKCTCKSKYFTYAPTLLGVKTLPPDFIVTP